jgi:transposase InsO family protein
MWLLDEERAIRKRQSEAGHGHTSAYFSRSSPGSTHSGRYRPHSHTHGSSQDGLRGSRPFLPHEPQDLHYQRAQEIAARKQVSRCSNCGEIGHWHKECPRPPRRPASARNFSHQNPADHSSSSSSATGISSSSSQDSRSPARSPHVTMTTPRAYMVQFLDQEVHPTDWLADSGSSHHMSDQRAWFTNFTAVPTGTWPVQAVAGHTTFVEGIRDIPIEIYIRDQWEHGLLTDVLYVPALQRNLFSVSSAAFKNVDTLYTRTGCRMMADGNVLMEGSLEGMLYKLHIRALPSTHVNVIQSLGTSSKSDGTRSLAIWHQRLCHLNYPTILAMDRTEAVTGTFLQNKQIPEFCQGCVLGKSHRHTFPSSPIRTPSTIPGYRIHADLCGPMAHVSLGGALYYLLFKDDYSGYRYIFCLAEKSDALRCFQEVYSDIFRDTGHHMQIFRTDGGGEFTSKKFQACLSEKGVRHEVTAPYSPEQNGLIERDNRTIMESVRSLLHTSGLPLSFWAEACHTVVYTLNRTGSRLIPGSTPFTLWYGFKPSLEHFRVFGCQVYAYIDKKQRTKLDPKSHLCYFLGYCDNTKGYRIWDPETSQVLIRRDVSFNEQVLYGDQQETLRPSSSSEQELTATLSTDVSSQIQETSSHSACLPNTAPSSSYPSEPTLTHTSTVSDPSYSLPVNGQQETPLVSDSVSYIPLTPLTPRTLTSHPNFQPDTPVRMRSLTDIDRSLPQSPSSTSVLPLAQANIIEAPISPPVTGSSSLEPVVSSTDTFSSVTADFSPDDPNTYIEALHSPDAAQWVHAMTEEVNSLKENKTWELVRLPDGRQAIQCKWVFKTKYLPNGNIDKFKARLVAKGYTQKAGIDYSETFSPVVKFETVRIVMAITAADDLEIVQFDIKTAFLNGDIAELLYMEQPEGFIDKDHPDYVCLLHKALYGLKQASRNWNSKFHKFLLQFGFTASDADPCAYYSSQGGQTIILLIYVDDGLICFSRGTNIDHILNTMDKAFSNTRGPAGCYVGLRITRRRETNEIFLDQTHYLTKLVRKFGFHDAIPLSVPADPHSPLSFLSSDASLPATPFPYQTIVGCLQFACIGTRPDLSYAVSVAAKYCVNPSPAHCNALRRILKYLAGTLNLGLSFSGDNHPITLTAYSDADFAMDLDDRKSRIGFVLFVNHGPVFWASRKQTSCASSTTEAEYLAASATTKEIIWHRRLLASLGKAQITPTHLFTDNRSALRLIKNPEFHRRTKHIDVQYHVIREAFLANLLLPSFVSSHDQLADIFTKALSKETFQRLRHQLGICSVEH